jgi:hypothetical protein
VPVDRRREQAKDVELVGDDVDRDWLRGDAKDDAKLSARLATIDEFVQRCEELGDRRWLMPAARLFLCTRPPSYFDIARRWLWPSSRCNTRHQGLEAAVHSELSSRTSISNPLIRNSSQ